MSLSNIAISASNKVAKSNTKVEKDADIIEFVEASWGLKMTLFPVQKVILKAHYGLALDPNTKFKITDWRRENERIVSEPEYLKILYEEGRCNVKEVIPGKQRREMILSIGRRSGKCVTGDTLVLTDKGLMPIKSLGNDDGAEIQPLNIQVIQEKGKKARSAYFYNGGVRSVRRVHTFNGYTLAGTDNHRIKVMSKYGDVVWKYMSDIGEGDYVCIAKGSNFWSKDYVDMRPFHHGLNLLKEKEELPNVFDEEWGALMGMLCGDGSWTEKRSVSITVGEEEFQKQVFSLFTKLMGDTKGYKYKNKPHIMHIAKHSKDFRELLERMGWVSNITPQTKRVPSIIFQSPKSVVCAFLKGLFETDGSILQSGHLCYVSASHQLAKEVHLLLCNLGIISSFKVFRDKYWGIHVRHKQSRRLLKQLVGFFTEKKKSRLKDNLSNLDNEETYYIPHQEEWVRLAVSNLTLPKKEENYFKKILKGDRMFRYKDAKFLAQIASGQNSRLANHFNELLDLDFFYDPVAVVTEGEERVYDLNVPDGSMFIANGMVNHNTTISACIAAYETYKLIKKQDPQEYYGLPSSNNIQIISVATDKDQAGLLYQEVSGHYRNCAFFAPFTANNTQSYARFQTPKDVERYGRYIDTPTAKATLKITFRSCIAKGLRGAGNICVIMDEVAHFTDSGQSSADEVYNAVVPSTSAYSPKDKDDRKKPVGEVEGRVILISSPLGKQGLFYNMFQIGMRGGTAAENILSVQAPTWEVNPTIPASEFEKHYLKNAAVFFTEYGGEFTDRTRGWIEKDEDVYSCVDPALKPMERGITRRPHFIGIDLGLVGDGTAIAIGHLDGENIVVDLVTQIKAGEGKYKDKERLDFDDVADWILDLSKRFYVTHGMFDQWAGIPFEQALTKRGLSQMKSELLTKPLTSQIYQNFKDMMWDKRLKFYDNPNPQANGHAPYLLELLELQATVHSKNVITVEAPQTEGKHDDMSDALVRMVWLASNHITKQKSFGGSGTTNSGLSSRGLTFGYSKPVGGANPELRRAAPKQPRGYNLRDSLRRGGR